MPRPDRHAPSRTAPHEPGRGRARPGKPLTREVGDGQSHDVPRLVRAPSLLLAFLGIHLLAVWTPIGQWAENSLIRGYADRARILPLAQSWGPPPLTDETATVATGLVVIAAVTLVRRCWREGCAAVATVVVTLAATEALSRYVLVRPDLVGADDNLRAASFPSGHVAIAAALTLGLLLVTPGRVRGYVATAGALWVAVIAGAVQALYWHRPSDVLGATLLACAAHSAVGRLLAAGPTASRRGARLALVLVAAGAVAAASREDGVARPLVFAAAAFASGALVWSVAALDARAAPREPDDRSGGTGSAKRTTAPLGW
ncbi:phosphatase PAP2 family protein [Streptomyces sp. cg36]|uniref:phosphatase PAP2 family protein n=1 Tax=Streptomyces sp. cg36 TaxID=3238798 RepID=UPI0034E2EB0D